MSKSKASLNISLMPGVEHMIPDVVEDVLSVEYSVGSAGELNLLTRLVSGTRRTSYAPGQWCAITLTEEPLPEAKPEFTRGIWTGAQANQAQAEGWCIGPRGYGPIIQATDNDMFLNAAGAMDWVKRRASEGSAFHLHALGFAKSRRPEKRAEWTPTDANDAKAEGWAVRQRVMSGMAFIEVYDHNIFACDKDAEDHVMKRASEGSFLHLRAIAYVEATNNP